MKSKDEKYPWRPQTGLHLLRLATDAGDAVAACLIRRQQPHLMPVTTLAADTTVPGDDVQWTTPMLHAAVAHGEYARTVRKTNS